MNKLGIWAIAIAGAFLIGAFTANPIVEAQGGWKLAIDEITSEQPVYEVSVDTVILEGDRLGALIQLRCLEGDYITGAFTIEGDDTGFPDGSEVNGANVQNVVENSGSKIIPSKPIGVDLQPQFRDTPPHMAPFNIELTVTILCLNPDFLNPALFN